MYHHLFVKTGAEDFNRFCLRFKDSRCSGDGFSEYSLITIYEVPFGMSVRSSAIHLQVQHDAFAA